MTHRIGHRGAKGYAAENTLASFKKAIELEVDGIELDVHMSFDGAIIVIHDESIDRTTTETGFIKDFSAQYLNQIGIPTLEEVLNLIDKKCFVNIEIKDKKATEKVVNCVKKYILEYQWSYHSFQISCFDWSVLEAVTEANPNIRIGVLTDDSIENAIAFAKKNKAYAINPYFKLLNAENVKAIHNNGFKIYPWTVNSLEDLIFVKSLEVDGIISDFPDRI